MANEIKLDGLSSMHTATNSGSKKPSTVGAIVPPTNEGITITNQLGNLVTTLVAENKTPENHQRIFELKQQIEKKQYHVDLDALATKLVHTLVS